MIQHLKQHIMTLALLVTAAAGAWAQSLSTYSELTLEIGSGGSIELNHDYYAYDYGYPIVITQDNSVIDGKGAVIDMAGAGIDHALKITASDVTIKNLIIINHTQAGDAIFFEEGGYMMDVLYDALPLTSQTANPWTFMLKYNNVLVNVAYKDRTSIALTFDGAAIPAAGVKGFLGLEQEFIAKLTAAVTNTDDNNAAVDNAELTFTSSDATVIAFGSNNKASGKLADIMFLKQSTEPVTLTAAFDGTADLGKSPEQTLAVTVGEKTYTVSMAENTADADNWQGSLNGGQDYADLPIVSVKNNPVTMKYNGRLKVKSVTATHDGENVDETTVKITTSDISEGDASVVFNVQLSKAPQGEATVQVKVGETTFDVAVDASGKGVLTLDNANDDDPYLDASTITAEVVGVTGGNYENVVTGQKATAIIRDTINDTIVSITCNNFHEGDASVVFNVFFSNATLGEAIVQVQVGNTIHNVIFSAGILTETLTLDNPHTSSVTAEIVEVTGGFFENIVFGGQKATAYLE